MKKLKKVRIVTVTARNQDEFPQFTLLGKSLSIFPEQKGLNVSVFLCNSGPDRKGLGVFYNEFLQTRYKNEILLFVHDDVYLHDWHLVQRLNDAMEQFDIVGLAGNTNPDLAEPSWALAWNREKYPNGQQPVEFYSGAVGQVVEGKTKLYAFGVTPRPCVLLDGLFLAVNTAKILEKGIRFDPQYEFHLYDLDFCRQCHSQNLRLGTWPIAVTHGSRGQFNSPEWNAARDLYLRKWQKEENDG